MSYTNWQRKGGRTHKYNAQKVEIDGHKFDSKAEGQRYCELKMLERSGLIQDLKLQPRFELIPAFEKNGVKYRKTEYVADFQYVQDGKVHVEDVKSPATRTDVYRIKKKLFENKFDDLTIEEVEV